MGRPPEPRSRSAAARLTGVHESTLRSLERTGDLPPATDWTPADLVWAKVLTTPGVERTALPHRPAVFAPGSYLVAAHTPALSTAASLIGVVATLESLPGQSAVVLPVGDWTAAIEAQWR
jgi:hypothetical protein